MKLSLAVNIHNLRTLRFESEQFYELIQSTVIYSNATMKTPEQFLKSDQSYQ